MPNFRRSYLPGGTFFFTVNTRNRHPLFRSEMARNLLHEAIETTRAARPFRINAMVLLPDHLHCIWTLELTDADYSTRWRKIKECFTRSWLESGGAEQTVSVGKSFKGERGIWQSRFWEHTIRDENDLNAHLDYIHYNPVKHGHAQCPHAWSWSSFMKCVREGWYAADWGCACDGRNGGMPHLDALDGKVGE